MAEEAILIAISVAFSIAAAMLAPRPPGQPNPQLILPSCSEGDPIPVLYGRMLVPGHYAWPAGQQQMNLVSTKSSLKWLLSWDIVLTHGPMDAIFTIFFGDNIVWQGVVNRPLDGSPVTLTRTDGLRGTIRVYWGVIGSVSASVDLSDLNNGNQLITNRAYPLGHAGILLSTVTVGDGTNFLVEGTDYKINYITGSITLLHSIGLPSTLTMSVAFQYNTQAADPLIVNSTSDPDVAGGHNLTWKSFAHVVFDHCDVGFGATVPNIKIECARGSIFAPVGTNWTPVQTWASPARTLINIGVDTSNFDGTPNYELKIHAQNYKVGGVAIQGWIDVTITESINGSPPATVFDSPLQMQQTAVVGTHGILIGFTWQGTLPFTNAQHPIITVDFQEGLNLNTGNVNPVDVLYDMLTNQIYGVGLDPSQIDLPSFLAARAICAQENRLVSLYINTVSPFMQWAQGVLFHIDGGIIQREGILVLKMLRRTYSGGSDSSILAIAESDLSDVSVETGQLSQTVNYLQAQFTDSTREYTTSIVPVADIGNAIALGNVRRQTLNLPYFTDITIATQVAIFKGQLLMTAHDTLSCSINRKAAALLEWGDVIKADYPLAGVTQSRLWRVMGLKRSPRDPKYVTITAVEEIGFLNATPAPPSRGGGGGGGGGGSSPIQDFILTKIPLELPWELDQAMTGQISALVNRENAQYNQFNLFGALGSSALNLLTSGGVVTTAGGKLTNDYTKGAYAIDDTIGIIVEPRVPSDWILLQQIANITRDQMESTLSQKLIIAKDLGDGLYQCEIMSFQSVILDQPEGNPTNSSTALSTLNSDLPPVANLPYVLGFRNIVNGSVIVTDGTQTMTEGVDYDISYLSGLITFLRDILQTETDTFTVDFQYKTLPLYRILGIVRGLMDTRAQDWASQSYVFINVSSTVGFSTPKPGSWAAALTAQLKAVPYSSLEEGNSALFESQPLVIQNRASCPNSVASLAVDGRGTVHARQLSPADTPRISWIPSNRATGAQAPGQPLFFGSQITPEPSTYRIRVYDNTGTLLATHDWDSSADGTFTDALGVVRPKYDYTVPSGGWTSLKITVNAVLNGLESRDEFGPASVIAFRHA